MSRPREFDEQQALQQAKEVFWQRSESTRLNSSHSS